MRPTRARGADLFIEKDERQHGATQAPLVGAVLKECDLKQSRQDGWEELWPLPQVLPNRLQHAAKRVCIARRRQEITSRECDKVVRPAGAAP